MLRTFHVKQLGVGRKHVTEVRAYAPRQAVEIFVREYGYTLNQGDFPLFVVQVESDHSEVYKYHPIKDYCRKSYDVHFPNKQDREVWAQFVLV